MKKQHIHGKVKHESKRSQELWIYSFADMYMILSVFFIAISMIYSAKAKEQPLPQVATAGRGPASVESSIDVPFPTGSDSLEQEALDSLQLLLPVLRASRSLIDVEGYADGSRLSKGAKFSSNLSLSNSRAVRVSEWLINNGIASSRVRTFSYGDGRQFSKGSDGVPTNRRVVIKLLASRGAP